MYPMCPTRNVYPSGFDCATLAAPMVPPAPGTFSITIDWLAPRDMRSANWRASVSVAPPAANGTTQVIGWSGYCAFAAPAAAARIAAAIALVIAFMLLLLVIGLECGNRSARACGRGSR